MDVDVLSIFAFHIEKCLFPFYRQRCLTKITSNVKEREECKMPSDGSPLSPPLAGQIPFFRPPPYPLVVFQDPIRC